MVCAGIGAGQGPDRALVAATTTATAEAADAADRGKIVCFASPSWVHHPGMTDDFLTGAGIGTMAVLPTSSPNPSRHPLLGWPKRIARQL